MKREKPILPLPESLPDDQILPGVTRAPSYNYWAVPSDVETNPIRPMVDAWNARYEWCRSHVVGTVVDAACGWGKGSALLASFSPVEAVIGYDLWDRAVEAAKQNTKDLPCTFEVGDFGASGFAFPSCDSIVCLETLEHIPEPEAFVLKMCAAASRRIVISVPPVKINSARRNEFHEQEIPWEKVIEWMRAFGPMREERELWSQRLNGTPVPISMIGAWEKNDAR